MKVYVLLSWWDTDDSDGRKVLGVFADRPLARIAMQSDIDVLRDGFERLGMEWNWDPEYTEEQEDYVYLAHKPMDPIAHQIYCWEVLEREVQTV